MEAKFTKPSLITFIFTLIFLLAGCGSPGGPNSDWNNRIGNFTYEQAKAELGKPDKVNTLDDGGVLAEWITRHNVTNPGNPGMDTGLRAGGVDQPVNTAAQQTMLKTEFLDLTFAPNGKLAKVEKVYR